MDDFQQDKKEDVKDVLKSARDIGLSFRKLSDSRIHGAHMSMFKGRGLEFSEIRGYVPGDDVRAIDWNVTARFGHPFVKDFVEERDMTVYLVVDISGSFDFGTQDSFKRMAAAKICASVALSAIKNNDSIGLVLFSDRVEKCIHPSKGKKHMMRIVSEIVSFESKSRGTGLKAPLGFLSNVIKQKSILFLISDFMDDVRDYSRELGYLSKENDVIAVDFYDAREVSIPDVGLIELEDEETGEQMLVDTSDSSFRADFEEHVCADRERLIRFMRKKRIDYVSVSTTDDGSSKISGLLKMRVKRRLFV
ncbi:MAG: DUF58 domain-containing protein [DPANN group archaeon]|nr:DUF58 domain-containing protein [DPANN group archaeon]